MFPVGTFVTDSYLNASAGTLTLTFSKKGPSFERQTSLEVFLLEHIGSLKLDKANVPTGTLLLLIPIFLSQCSRWNIP
jgi:hypothetical protein